MKKMKFTIENLPFELEIPEKSQKQADLVLALSNEYPLNITINGNNFVLMQEEYFDELLAADEEYMEEYEAYEFDCEEEVEEDIEDSSCQSIDLEEATVGLIISLLDDVQLNFRHISVLKDVVDSHLTLASVREIFGGEEV